MIIISKKTHLWGRGTNDLSSFSFLLTPNIKKISRKKLKWNLQLLGILSSSIFCRFSFFKRSSEFPWHSCLQNYFYKFYNQIYIFWCINWNWNCFRATTRHSSNLANSFLWRWKLRWSFFFTFLPIDTHHRSYQSVKQKKTSTAPSIISFDQIHWTTFTK